MNKNIKWLLISLPILIGGFIVFKTLRKQGKEKKKDDITPIDQPQEMVVTTPSQSDKFPLALGSRGEKVKQLQQAIIDDGQVEVVKLLGNAGADGKFGTGTEKAVKAILNKTTVDSQSDIDKIKNLKASREASISNKKADSDRIALANLLISKFKADPINKNFYSIRRHSGSTGNITSDGRQVRVVKKVWEDGSKVGFSRNAKFTVDRVGNITAIDGSNFSFFNPSWVEVK
jgi:peptidoglycan hydrolase-like protein with peptidoglycan-binding domain